MQSDNKPNPGDGPDGTSATDYTKGGGDVIAKGNDPSPDTTTDNKEQKGGKARTPVNTDTI